MSEITIRADFQFRKFSTITRRLKVNQSEKNRANMNLTETRRNGRNREE